MDDIYYFHQTPSSLAKDLVALTPISTGDKLFEPFAGENAFYNNFPDTHEKDWAEITRGRDYKDAVVDYDWVITNPPFRLEQTEGRRINAFWLLLDYYTTRARKGIAFLVNDKCFSALTPNRMELLKTRGWGITKIVVCAVKKWRGRYFYVIVQKSPEASLIHLKNNYE